MTQSRKIFCCYISCECRNHNYTFNFRQPPTAELPFLDLKGFAGMLSVKIKVVSPQRPRLCLILLYVDFPSVNYKEHGQAEERGEDIKVVGFVFYHLGVELGGVRKDRVGGEEPR